MNLYKDLQEKLSEHNPNEVDELILDDLFDNISSFSLSNKKDLEKYSNLVHLSLNNLGLENLSNFPSLPLLQILELKGNKLTGNDFEILVNLYPQLYKLKIGNNPLKSISYLDCFKNSHIEKIEIDGTPISQEKFYKEDMFRVIPSLIIINNITKEGDNISTTSYEDLNEDDNDNFYEDEEDDYQTDELESYN